MSNFFYHVYSASDTPCNLTKDADAEARRTWLCAGCGSPKPGVSAIGARLRVRPDKAPLNFVAGTRLSIASKAFLDALGNDLVQRDLYVGRVYGPDGQELNEWATFHGKHKLIVRGNEHASYRRCTDCGQHAYFAMGKKYLYPAPQTGVALFDCGSLVLTEEVFLRANIEKLRGIYIEKLSVSAADKQQDT